MASKPATLSEPFDVGGYHFEPIGERSLKHSTIKVVKSQGPACIFKVSGPDGIDLELADVRWDNGEREIRVVGRGNSPEKYDHLKNKRRVAIKSAFVVGQPNCVYMELAQARWKSDEDDRSSKYWRVTIQELSKDANTDITGALMQAGATKVDTRENVRDDRSSRKHVPCVMFDKSNSRVPIIAYVLSRIAPLVRGVTEIE